MGKEKEQLWLIETYKGNILEKGKTLVKAGDLGTLVNHFAWFYTSYDPEKDYILIKPSDITYYEEVQTEADYE